MGTTWIKEIKWGKLLLTGAIFTVVSLVIRQVESFLTIKYYMMPQYFGVWSKLMMPNPGPPPANFMITSFVFTFVTGISLGLIYFYLRNHLPKERTKRVFYFADLMIGTSFIFFTLPVYLLFNVPFGLLLSWFISSFIVLVIASATFVKIIN